MSPAKIKSDIKKNYNRLGINHAVDWGKIVIYNADRQEKIRSKEPIGTSVRSSEGGNEHPTSSGPYKENLENTESGSINADYVLDASNIIGGTYSPNKFTSVKDWLDVLKNVNSGIQLGGNTAEAVEKTSKEIYKEFVTYIKSVDISTNDNNSTTTTTNFGVLEIKGTKEEIQAKIDSLHQEGIKKGEKAHEKK